MTVFGCATEALAQSAASGAAPAAPDAVVFFVDPAAWADVHYSINGGPQLNVRMVREGDRNTLEVAGLSDGDAVAYSFTYFDLALGAAVGTVRSTYTHGGAPPPPPVDSDGDGVPDDVDQCPGTVAGTAVDDVGCPVSTTSIAGLTTLGSDAVEFFVETTGWADVHYVINGGSQINVRMTQAGGRNTWPVTGLMVGDSIGYSFTYWDVSAGAAVETPVQSYVHDGDAPPPIIDSDGDGVPDGLDQCPQTPPGVAVDEFGCPQVVEDSDGDGVPDALDRCPQTPPGVAVDAVGCRIELGTIVPLYGPSTPLEPPTTVETETALITRFTDRARDRHAKENHFQAYDHYLSFYWEFRTAQIEIIDRVAKGGSTVRMNVTTDHPLDTAEAENRWFYMGNNTLAEYCANGVMQTRTDVSNPDPALFYYFKEERLNCREGFRPIRNGDKLEFEVSQFLNPAGPVSGRGRANYYGTTYLYIVGEGIVPWEGADHLPFVAGRTFQRDSVKIPPRAWLGGGTTIHAAETAEPDNHFMQMATNLGYGNGPPFVAGRRLIHTSLVDGDHVDESPDNPAFNEMAGKAGPRYTNESCISCHVRNGRAAPDALGVPLTKWVFRLGDATGRPDPYRGSVLQPVSLGGIAGEGAVSIAGWNEANGLRAPVFQFSSGAPAMFSARIAPQLVGIGLLEAIAEADVLALEDPDDADGDGISGRAQRVTDPGSGVTRLGRFGWKASTVSVRHQIAAALNGDMGVTTSLLPNPDCGREQTNCGGDGMELSDEHLDTMVKYVSLLGVRPQRDHSDDRVQAGQRVFVDVGCAGCHIETFQTSVHHPLAELRDQTIHPYTDLLLHDMGPGLADGLGEEQASGGEWRTAPLWGLGLSACVTGGTTGTPGGSPFGVDGGERCRPVHSYLHDGRARSIEEAIRWHGGEAAAARQAFDALSDNDRSDLLAFLASL